MDISMIDNRDTQTCIRVLIFLSCFCATVIAFVLIGYGGSYLENLPYDDVNLYRTIKTTSIMNIVIGFVTVVVSIVGCCSSIVNSKLLYKIFAGLLMVNGLLMMGFGIYLVVTSAKRYDQKLRRDLEKMLIIKFIGYFLNWKDRNYLDDFQTYYRCCGVYNPKDWKQEPPRSCYTNGLSHTKGCIEAFSNISPVMLALGIVLIVAAIFDVALALLVVYLAKIIRPGAQNYPYFNNPVQVVQPTDNIYPRGQYNIPSTNRVYQ
ncbi:unnamed protein product [Ceutorhynchus assimilis]|uniref:Tetraspanin n=1 Tax=Ceutorhynchus assimilis TaxID=467358 RepID=A0A9N9QPC3_9CUCU|nr:unnamed protein product [Ceutorhynchus assimilis]